MAGAGFRDWVAGATVASSDVDTYLQEQTVMQFATSAARDTALASVLDEGLLTSQADSNCITAYSGSAWSTVGPLWGALTAYTPSLTNITIGNGTVNGSYSRIGRYVVGGIRLTFGTTTSVTGSMAFSIPVASQTTTPWSIETDAVLMYDSSANARYPGRTALVSSSSFSIQAINAAGTYAVQADTSSTVPFTWATSDIVIVRFAYEAAADA